MAFEFARTCQQDVTVLAFESRQLSRPGQRRYLITTNYEFGKRYMWVVCRMVVWNCLWLLCFYHLVFRSMKPPRHFYEVIPECELMFTTLTMSSVLHHWYWVFVACMLCVYCAADSVCHLYFDIEFKLTCNTSCDPLKILDHFIQVCVDPCMCVCVCVNKKGVSVWFPTTACVLSAALLLCHPMWSEKYTRPRLLNTRKILSSLDFQITRGCIQEQHQCGYSEVQ